jgi:hypothetical protein
MSSEEKKINFGSPPIMFSVGYMNKTIADGIALTPIITPVGLKQGSTVPLQSFAKYN